MRSLPISRISVVSIFFISMLVSCTSTTGSKIITSKGEPGRLILVSTDQLYNELDAVIDDVFLEPQPWLPMTEAYFKPSRMNNSSFRRSFVEHQTILFLVTKQNYEELSAYIPELPEEELDRLYRDNNSTPFVVKNKFASPQRIYFMFAPDMQTMREKLLSQKDRLLSVIYENEVRDYHLRLFKGKDTSNMKYKAIKEELGMGVAISDKFDLMKKEKGFFWYSERYTDEQLGIICYKVPYTDTAQFNDRYLFALRDSTLKYQIPGPRDGTYMTTSGSDLYPRFSETTSINGLYAKKLRGWWTVHGEFMGGPFVMYAVLDKESKYIFIYEGYIYAPNKSKSKNLRTLEAIGYSIQ